MPIDSSSTLAQVQAAYDDNASYEEEASAAKARAFITAARILLRRVPEDSSTPQAQVRYRIDLIEKAIVAAQQWLSANAASAEGSAPSSQIKRASFQYFRE